MSTAAKSHVKDKFAEFIADDERHTRRHLVRLQRGGEILGFGHRLRGLFQIRIRQASKEIRRSVHNHGFSPVRAFNFLNHRL